MSDAAFARLPQVETNVDLDLPPYLHETIRVVQELSSGKAPGSDAISVEIYKRGGPQLMDHLTALLQAMWRQGEVRQDFKDATIVHLCKRKGSRQICNYPRGISLLNITGKVFARILLKRLNNHLEHGPPPESHFGFLRRRRTTDMIFVAANFRRYEPTLLCLRRSDEGLRHGESQRTVENHAEIRLSQTIHSDGCIFAPTLISLMFTAMLMEAYLDEHPDICIAYTTDRHLLNHWQAHFQLRVSTITTHELLFADDCALTTTSEGAVQKGMDLFAAAWWNVGLIINTGKTLRPRRSANSEPPPTCPPIALVGHLRTNCSSRTAPTVVSPSTFFLPPTSSTNSDRPPEPAFPHPPPQRLVPWRLPRTSTLHTILTHQQIPLSPPWTSLARTWSMPVLVATAPSPHTSAGSVTRESIVQILADRYLEHRSTSAAFATTVRIALKHSCTVWAYLITCVSTRAEMTAALAHPGYSPCLAPPMLRRPVRPPSAVPPQSVHIANPLCSAKLTPRLPARSPPPPQPPRLIPTSSTSYVHTVPANSPHVPAWSVTCESIALELATQCLEHQRTFAASASAFHIAHAYLFAAWVYEATRVSTKTCGRPLKTASRHQIPPPASHRTPISSTSNTQPPSPASGKRVSRFHLYAAPQLRVWSKSDTATVRRSL
ncbi:hypothetical protein SprV_0501961800 [Sparganum proliferum]